jgi:hypothetical protein
MHTVHKKLFLIAHRFGCGFENSTGSRLTVEVSEDKIATTSKIVTHTSSFQKIKTFQTTHNLCGKK